MLDLVAPVIGVIGLFIAADVSGGPYALSLLRILSGAFFLGSVTDAMLLGHWYLVQPGLARGPLLELVRWTGLLWPVEVVAMLVPTGMFSVFSGSIDDGYGGILGWFWVACAVTTIALVFVTRARPQGALLLGGHGRHRLALPGDPHRLRHGPGRAGCTFLGSKVAVHTVY